MLDVDMLVFGHFERSMVNPGGSGHLLVIAMVRYGGLSGPMVVPTVVLSKVRHERSSISLLVVPVSVVVLVVGGYETEKQWMSLFRDMIFCVFCINKAR